MINFGIMSILTKHKKEIERMCEQYQVRHLYAFGSVLTSDFKNDSDIDFLVRFDEIKHHSYFSNFFDFKFALGDLLERDIDLIEEQALKNPYLLKSFNQSKSLVYG